MRGMFQCLDVDLLNTQVAPAELEDLLLQHDAVADVGVIGVPHESDELVRAYVVRQPGSDVTAEELIKHVAGWYVLMITKSISINLFLKS